MTDEDGVRSSASLSGVVMIEPFCDRCKKAVRNMPMGRGGCVSICYQCSIWAAAIYINKQRKIMETIKSKRVLHGRIKKFLENLPEENITFPQFLTFSEGIGTPTFKLTIEKSEDDFFVDDKGVKWVKAR